MCRPNQTDGKTDWLMINPGQDAYTNNDGIGVSNIVDNSPGFFIQKITEYKQVRSEEQQCKKPPAIS